MIASGQAACDCPGGIAAEPVGQPPFAPLGLLQIAANRPTETHQSGDRRERARLFQVHDASFNQDLLPARFLADHTRNARGRQIKRSAFLQARRPAMRCILPFFTVRSAKREPGSEPCDFLDGALRLARPCDHRGRPGRISPAAARSACTRNIRVVLRRRCSNDLAELYRKVDAFAIVSGEYNHGIPPALKNLLDHFLEDIFLAAHRQSFAATGRRSSARAATMPRRMTWPSSACRAFRRCCRSRVCKRPLPRPATRPTLPSSSAASAFSGNSNGMPEPCGRRARKNLPY